MKRGPIFVIDNPTLTQISPQTGSNDSRRQRIGSQVAAESPSLHSSHVVMVGVSAEIAVVIAVASFGIGALLTGMLCWVHHRRSMPKVRALKPEKRVKTLIYAFFSCRMVTILEVLTIMIAQTAASFSQ